jgi:putative sigma-54 modulation protein
MNLEIKGIHCEVDERIRDYVDKKMQRLEFAKDYIVDFLVTFAKEKNLYKLEATINLRWGSAVHVGVDAFDLYPGIDALYDKLEAKIEKEKSKIQTHRKKEAARTEEA